MTSTAVRLEVGDFRIFDRTVRFVGEPVAVVVARTDRALLARRARSGL